MDFAELPEPLRALLHALIPTIREVYDVNAERYDELMGDDAIVFGINVYRNSWFRVEQEVASSTAGGIQGQTVPY